MTKIKTTNVALRFGARYGKRNRDKFGAIEMVHRSTHKCPYCNYESVKRKAAGIWECKKCGAKFTGRAYSPNKTKIKSEAKGQKELIATAEEKKIVEEDENYEEELKEESKNESSEESNEDSNNESEEPENKEE